MFQHHLIRQSRGMFRELLGSARRRHAEGWSPLHDRSCPGASIGLRRTSSRKLKQWVCSVTDSVILMQRYLRTSAVLDTCQIAGRKQGVSCLPDLLLPSSQGAEHSQRPHVARTSFMNKPHFSSTNRAAEFRAFCSGPDWTVDLIEEAQSWGRKPPGERNLRTASYGFSARADCARNSHPRLPPVAPILPPFSFPSTLPSDGSRGVAASGVRTFLSVLWLVLVSETMFRAKQTKAAMSQANFRGRSRICVVAAYVRPQ
ncbi:hypothetical protein F4780DRAFT_591513 [Xylariomycetidae sp. FL0641]|nr:hypothetical protein F4780DRAFT_591513 [Xylariomycetidae sp. FL0641]